jgi:hypothetical protein
MMAVWMMAVWMMAVWMMVDLILILDSREYFILEEKIIVN